MSLTETNRLRAAVAAAGTVRKLMDQCERADARYFDGEFRDSMALVIHRIDQAEVDAVDMLGQRRAKREAAASTPDPEGADDAGRT
jgi:hypothetical protein